MTASLRSDVAESDTHFRYKALRQDGMMLRGTVTAVDRRQATVVLYDQGLVPLELTPTRARSLGRPPNRSELGAGLRILASLLASGIPMARALSAFEELAPRTWRTASSAMRERIRRGGRLGDALREEAGVAPVLAGIISAGEAAGRIGDAVLRAAELAEESASLEAAIRGALVYPAVLLAAGIGSVGILIGVVLPRFAGILADLGQAPPPLTQLVLSISVLVHSAGLPAGLLIGLLFAGWRAWIATPTGREAWDDLLLRVPVIGGIRISATTSRLCVAMAALLDAGVPVANALQHAASAAGNAAAEGRVRAARERVVRGEPVGAALADAHALSPAAVRLIRAGAESGQLAAMFAHAGRMEGDRAREATRAAVRLLEPALILVFGAIVAVVAGALLQAVYAVHPVQ